MNTIDVSFLFVLAKKAIGHAQRMSRASRFHESLAYQRTALSYYQRAFNLGQGAQKEKSKRLYDELLEGYVTVLMFRILCREEQTLLIDFFRLRKGPESITGILGKVQRSFDHLIENLAVVDEDNIPKDLPRVVTETVERWRDGALSFDEVDKEIDNFRKKLTDWGARYFAGL